MGSLYGWGGSVTGQVRYGGWVGNEGKRKVERIGLVGDRPAWRRLITAGARSNERGSEALEEVSVCSGRKNKVVGVQKGAEPINKALSNKASVLRPTSPSSRRCAATALATLGGPSLVCSEVQGEVCWEKGTTRRQASSARRWRLRARRVCKGTVDASSGSRRSRHVVGNGQVQG